MLLPVGRADDVEHNVDAAAVGALPDDLKKVLFLVVDAHVEAELGCLVELVGGAGGREGDRAGVPRELDARDADAAACGVDEGALAHDEVAVGEEGVVGGEEDLGD